jgi:hypothetical protein
MRGALDSIYSVLVLTRKTLRDSGPSIAQKQDSLGHLAIEILVNGIGKFTDKWHHILETYEHSRPKGKSPLEWEWELESEYRTAFFEEFEGLQEGMQQYIEKLAKIAGTYHEKESTKKAST